jgi:hypothetical protein
MTSRNMRLSSVCHTYVHAHLCLSILHRGTHTQHAPLGAVHRGLVVGDGGLLLLERHGRGSAPSCDLPPSCVATQLLLCVVHTWEECLLIEAALHYICSPVVAPVCLLLGRAALLERETTWASCLAASLPTAPNYSISVISTQHALPPVSTADTIF